MAEEDALARLKDIHLPQPINWWPLAPGWYLLVFAVLLLASVLFFFVYNRKKKTRPRNIALELLDHYKQQYEQEGDYQLTSARISELLRRVALVYYPRDQVAGLYGEQWLEFLNQTGKGIDFNLVQFLLLDLPYKSTEKPVDLNLLFISAERWIKQRGTPCSN